MTPRPGRRWPAVLAGALLLPALLGGCATQTNGASGDVARSMSEVAAAAESAALVVEQLDDGKTTDAVAGTTLSDMLDVVLTEQTTVAELDVGTTAEERLRAEAVAVMRGCVDAIAGARAALAGGGAGDGTDRTDGADAPAASRPLAELERAADDATGLSDRLEPYR